MSALYTWTSLFFFKQKTAYEISGSGWANGWEWRTQSMTTSTDSSTSAPLRLTSPTARGPLESTMEMCTPTPSLLFPAVQVGAWWYERRGPVDLTTTWWLLSAVSVSNTPSPEFE